jgi:TonB family protein
MFAEVHPVSEWLRNHRVVAASVLAHIGLLTGVLLYHPPSVLLTPVWPANGQGTQSYHVIYAPRDGEDDPDEQKVALKRSITPKAKLKRPKPTSATPPPDHLQVPADAIAADFNSRAGKALGTVIDGPIEGHEVHIAYPVIFPDPSLSRSDLSHDLQGDVIVEVTIDSEGNVVETRILQAIGHGIDEKIVAALKQRRYKPATLDGVPVASKQDVHFHFPS